MQQSSGRNCRESAGLCQIFKKHVSFVEFDRDRTCEGRDETSSRVPDLAREHIGAIMLRYSVIRNQPVLFSGG